MQAKWTAPTSGLSGNIEFRYTFSCVIKCIDLLFVWWYYFYIVWFLMDFFSPQSNICSKWKNLLGCCQELCCCVYWYRNNCKFHTYKNMKSRCMSICTRMLFNIQHKLLCSFQAPSNPDCGTTKVCFSQPSNCDPATSTSCYFMAVQTSNQSEMTIEMFGPANGYVAIGFSDDQEMVHTLIILAHELSDPKWNLQAFST